MAHRLTVKYSDRHSRPLRIVRTDSLEFDDILQRFRYEEALKERYSCVIRNRMKANEIFVCLNENELAKFTKE